ncbi:MULTISPECIES: RidA family protein [Kitasatospora]|uniref:RidA family protein n=1 Tax=Kitasatospora TaxID=2063 RepID=UPI000C70D217|nr:RidA family protein [Kitasatospora sp. GP30]MDH6144611.1 enamine deaminase RidA (YjgF/YER057c/UK114 family) [Kitasatospora sp. GP30]
MTDRQIVRGRLLGSSYWEEQLGSARAVAAGDLVLVSGCTAWRDARIEPEGDPFGQTLAAFGTAVEALAAYGLTADDVVRTRMYITHVRDADEVGRAHQQLFGAIQPATTMVVVAGLVDPRMMVEIELEAHRAGLANSLEGNTR